MFHAQSGVGDDSCQPFDAALEKYQVSLHPLGLAKRPLVGATVAQLIRLVNAWALWERGTSGWVDELRTDALLYAYSASTRDGASSGASGEDGRHAGTRGDGGL